MSAFDSWWRASKYCQAVIPRQGWEQIARDAWDAATQYHGEITEDAAIRWLANQGDKWACYPCRMTGRVRDITCQKCGGKGWHREHE